MSFIVNTEVGDVNYIDDFQFGAGIETNGGFKIIQHTRDRVCVIYRKNLTQNSVKDILRSAMKKMSSQSCTKK